MTSTRTRCLTALASVPLLLVGACGGQEPERPETSPAPSAEESAPDASEQAPEADAAAETDFLEVTADHLCEVQGQVYEDAESLAKAYRTEADYDGFDDSEVATLQKRLTQDAELSERLNDLVTQTCG